MRKLVAVALLDGRRFGIGLVSAALVAGLLPSLASGLGEPVPAATILAGVFLLVGATCGGYFGTDFAEGRSSFFFARPLPTWALIGGRAAALVALAGAAFLAFMASSWVSSTDLNGWTPWILERRHAYALGIAWSGSLFLSLGIAARARGPRGRSGIRDAVVIPLRLGASLAAFLLMFGLFADLILRAYFERFRPIELFLWSWAIASLVASFVAIAAGRTERLRIARFQILVMAVHFVLVSVAVIAAWSYVLHPDADAIVEVRYPTWGSPDGRTAFLSARVNRGDEKSFHPIYVLDLASGQATRLNSDRYAGPWTSADGSSVVWSEATPFFFRPLWRLLGGETTFRVRRASGEVSPLPMPRNAPDFRSASDLTWGDGVVNWVLPSPDGDVFAILWAGHLTFTSRSRGELSGLDLDLGPSRRMSFRTAVFMPTGELRTAIMRRDALGEQTLDFVDIEPRSGVQKLLFSLRANTVARIQFDASGSRALVTSGTSPGRGAVILLVHLMGTPEANAARELVKEVYFPGATFISDGRIVASGAGALAGDTNFLTIFSPEGEPVLKASVDVGFSPALGGEMFPGVMAVSIIGKGASFIDLNTGKLLRSLPNLRHLGNFFGSSPEGSAAARLLLSMDGKLYELPSVDAEPRLLLPLPRQ